MLSLPSGSPAPCDATLAEEIPRSTKVFRVQGSPDGKNLPHVLAGILRVPDELSAWRRVVVQQALEIVRKESPAFVVPMVPSHSLNIMAMEISRKAGIPMVPFFAGLWVADSHAEWSGGLQKFVHRLLERRTVKAASALVVASEGAAGYFLEKYPGFCPPAHVVECSFDPDRSVPAAPIEKGDTLRIGWVDSFRGVHTPDRVLSGIREYILRNPSDSIRIEHAGFMPGNPAKPDKVHFLGMLPWRRYPSFMASCHVLLLSLPPGPDSHRDCPAITADCLRSGRSIMAAVPEGDMSQKLRSLGSAYICQPDPMAVASTIENVYDHWRKGMLKLPRDPLRISEQLDGTTAMTHLAAFLNKVSG